MRKALAGKPVLDFPKPDSVVSATIDPTTGLLAVPGTARPFNEFYIEGTQPTGAIPDPAAAPAGPAQAVRAPEPETEMVH
jgi:membrane carboxypeptidase/penicillin-binding protein